MLIDTLYTCAWISTFLRSKRLFIYYENLYSPQVFYFYIEYNVFTILTRR